jgi:hypothetical protein
MLPNVFTKPGLISFVVIQATAFWLLASRFWFLASGQQPVAGGIPIEINACCILLFTGWCYIRTSLLLNTINA